MKCAYCLNDRPRNHRDCCYCGLDPSEAELANDLAAKPRPRTEPTQERPISTTKKPPKTATETMRAVEAVAGGDLYGFFRKHPEAYQHYR